MTDSISIVIPHYGDPQPTLDLIEQLQRQTGGVETQIIVSDDCSPEPFPEGVTGVTLVRREKNGGFGAAVNSGAREAKNEFLLIINSDVTIEDTFLRELLDGAKPWMPAVVSTVVMEESLGGSRCIGRYWPTASNMALETLDVFARFHGKDWFEKRIGNDVDAWHSPNPEVVDWAIGICLLMPTAEFWAVDGIDERYFMNCEEIDLQRKLHTQRGLPVVVLPAPLIQHVGGGSSDPDRRSAWLTDARFRYYEKWYGGPKFYLAMLASAGASFAWNGTRAALGRDVDAKGDFTRQLARIQHGWKSRK